MWAPPPPPLAKISDQASSSRAPAGGERDWVRKGLAEDGWRGQGLGFVPSWDAMAMGLRLEEERAGELESRCGRRGFRDSEEFEFWVRLLRPLQKRRRSKMDMLRPDLLHTGLWYLFFF
jgi:hypothetical protein